MKKYVDPVMSKYASIPRANLVLELEAKGMARMWSPSNAVVGHVARLRRAGISTEKHTTGRDAKPEHWAPRWAVLIVGAEPISEEQRAAALERAPRDEVFRNAVLSVWALSGPPAVARFVQDFDFGGKP